MVGVSNGLAEQMWLRMLERSSDRFRVAATKGLAALASDEPDWLIEALHQVHWSRKHNMADAVAYATLCSLLLREELFLCIRPCQSWAQPNSGAEANQVAVTSAGLIGTVNNSPQGFDGVVRPDPPLPMSRLYIDDEMTPNPAPIDFEDDGDYPLEIGDCSMSKSIAILMTTGRLARLPYGIRFDTDPGVFCLRMTGPTFTSGL